MEAEENKKKDVCASCDILKKEYPDFIANGIDEKMCASLANNTGLDEEKCVTNCDVLHDIADCLIGGFIESIDNYDYCDTKEMMTHLATNVLSVLDAIICSHCGQWEQIEAVWDEISGGQSGGGEGNTIITDLTGGVVEINLNEKEETFTQ